LANFILNPPDSALDGAGHELSIRLPGSDSQTSMAEVKHPKFRAKQPGIMAATL